MWKQRWLWAMTMVCLSAGAGLLRGDTYHTSLKPSLSGGIVGVVSPAKGLQTVIAFEPFVAKAYQGLVDENTGQFEFRGLPPGEYDLMIKTVGNLYEGLSLELKPGHRPNLKGLDKLSEEIGSVFFKTEDYFNVKRIVRLTATAGRARMLVVKTRTLPVVEPSGKPIKARIRRFDFVELLKTRKVWQILRSRHLLRQEVPYESKDIDIKLTYSPKLGGILVGRRVKNLGTIELKKLPKLKSKRYASADYERE